VQSSAEVHDQESIVAGAAKETQHERVLAEYGAIDASWSRRGDHGIASAQFQQVAMQCDVIAVRTSFLPVELRAHERPRVAGILRMVLAVRGDRAREL